MQADFKPHQEQILACMHKEYQSVVLTAPSCQLVRGYDWADVQRLCVCLKLKYEQPTPSRSSENVFLCIAFRCQCYFGSYLII